MRTIDRFLPPKQVTHPDFWRDYATEPWFKVLRAQRCLSVKRLAEELAQKAGELRNQSIDNIVQKYRIEHNLHLEARYRPRNEWRHLIP